MDEILKVDIDRFQYEDKTILEEVKFSAKRGECLVITGLSGCGKTTLLRLINGLIPELYEGKLSGRIELLGRELSSYKKGELAKHIGNVFQNPHDQFFSTVVEDEIAIVGENMGMEREELEGRVREAIERLKIKKLAGRSVFHLSGGEKQKVAIASTLVYDTDLIIFDEPSASLDYQTIKELSKTISYLKSMGKLVIIAEHRLYYLKGLIDRLLLIKDGSLKKIYSSDELTEEMRRENNLRSFDEALLSSEVKEGFGEEAIRIENFRIYQGENLTLKPLNLTLSKGECMGVIGLNGVGKTTFARQLTGLLPVKQGKTSFGETEKKRLSNTALTLQQPNNMLFRETVEKELISREKKKDEDFLVEVKEKLVDLELWEKRLVTPKDLSGGEKQRLALILTFLKEAKLDVLDEPTSGLDYKRMELVAKEIRGKKKKAPTILITHDLELLFKCCHTVLLLSKDGGEKLRVAGNEGRIREFLCEGI